MDANPDECMFCHEALPSDEERPVHLAFMQHIDDSESCNEAFQTWTDNMASDFQG